MCYTNHPNGCLGANCACMGNCSACGSSNTKKVHKAPFKKAFFKNRKAFEYVKSHIQKDIRCNRCNRIVLKSDIEDYSYQCMYHDEDLYSIETYKGKPYSLKELFQLILLTEPLLAD